uniref:Uncharacterized protein n=1 Tax=Meloidogyne floridensis TaxID=298350 RepID=A0A915NE93_9BILA
MPAYRENDGRRLFQSVERDGPLAKRNPTDRMHAMRVGKKELVRRTLAEDYPGLDYLGIHSVLNARYSWYRILWFSILSVCLLIGLFTIYRIIHEYVQVPSATLINVKSVDKLLLPQLTVCPTNAVNIDLEKLEKDLFVANKKQIEKYSKEDVFNFAFYMIAGSGFQFFDNFGLQCKQFLQHCQLGDTKLDCCKVFEPIYLIRRGRCFRTISLYQKNFDELGKLRIQLMHPPEMDKNLNKIKEIIAFVAEHKPQIAPFPRYYLYPNVWTKMRLSARRIRLFPAAEVCSDEYLNVGKDICYIERWIQTYLEGPLNSVEILCILACDRWEYTVSMEKIDALLVYGNSSPIPFAYRIDLSYNDLQFELIEEVATVTFMGLIAQIGGQMSLFMGSSILTLTQAAIMTIILIHRFLMDKQRQRNIVGDVVNNKFKENNGKEELNTNERINLNKFINQSSTSSSIPLNTISKSKISERNFDGKMIKL